MNSPSPNKPKAAYTINEVSELTSIDKRTIQKLIRSGRLKAVNVAVDQDTRPSWRITAKALQDFLTAA